MAEHYVCISQLKFYMKPYNLTCKRFVEWDVYCVTSKQYCSYLILRINDSFKYSINEFLHFLLPQLLMIMSISNASYFLTASSTPSFSEPVYTSCHIWTVFVSNKNSVSMHISPVNSVIEMFVYWLPEKSTAQMPLEWAPFRIDCVSMVSVSQTCMAGSRPIWNQ